VIRPPSWPWFTTTRPPRRTLRELFPHRRGMTLIELLISLSISTALLVALAAAFHAASRAVEVNDSYARSTQAARVALNQIVTEIRRADAVKVAPDRASLQVIRPPDPLSPGEIYREFAYDATGKRITSQTFYAGRRASPVYELAANVSVCTFGPVEAGADSNPGATAACIPIRITCSASGTAVTITGAATPRRAMRW
jgi:prepilin-type N-terminal cleavage/methylation domain-containing protein